MQYANGTTRSPEAQWEGSDLYTYTIISVLSLSSSGKAVMPEP
jgi:hypothetical protein